MIILPIFSKNEFPYIYSCKFRTLQLKLQTFTVVNTDLHGLKFTHFVAVKLVKFIKICKLKVTNRYYSMIKRAFFIFK